MMIVQYRDKYVPFEFKDALYLFELHTPMGGAITMGEWKIHGERLLEKRMFSCAEIFLVEKIMSTSVILFASTFRNRLLIQRTSTEST